jgi:hypothetical protein
MNRLTWDAPGLPKEYEPIPADGWPKTCQHEFGRHDFVENSLGRSYICKHCREYVLFRRSSINSRYEVG